MTPPTTTDTPSAARELESSGPAAAVVLSAGIGTFALGLVVALASAMPAFAKALDLWSPTGPLSGKTSVSVGAWALSWGVLHMMWRRTIVAFSRVWRWALALVVLGLVLTFPPVYGLLAPRG